MDSIEKVSSFSACFGCPRADVPLAKVTWDNLAIFSVQSRCVRNRVTTFDVSFPFYLSACEPCDALDTACSSLTLLLPPGSRCDAEVYWLQVHLCLVLAR